jgi:hypothetical protein
LRKTTQLIEQSKGGKIGAHDLFGNGALRESVQAIALVGGTFKDQAASKLWNKIPWGNGTNCSYPS